MNELSFKGRDRYRLSGVSFAGLIVVFVIQAVLFGRAFGAVAVYWSCGVLLALAVVGQVARNRSFTEVGPEGITICWGFGSGRTYAWKDIRWIEARTTRTNDGSMQTVRMHIEGGRRRSLPALVKSELYPSADFHVQFDRVVDWWELSTDESSRVRPEGSASGRVGTLGLTVVISLAIVGAVVAYGALSH